MVQNRVTLAIPQLPNSVQQQGITIKKKTPDLLMIVSFISPDGRYDDLYLSNFATIYVRDELLRVPGVSDITYLGERDYSIRAWLDPQKMAACGMTAVDVANAIRSQNLAAAARPARPGARAEGPGVPGADRRDGPARRPGAVRRDHRQGRRRTGPASSGSPRRPRAATPACPSTGATQAGGMAAPGCRRRGDDRGDPEPRLRRRSSRQGDGITVPNPPMGGSTVSNSVVSGLTPDPLPPLAIGNVGGTATSSSGGNATTAGGAMVGGGRDRRRRRVDRRPEAATTLERPRARRQVGTNASGGTSGAARRGRASGRGTRQRPGSGRSPAGRRAQAEAALDAASSGSATWPGSRWGPRTTSSPAPSTASRPSASPSASSRGPTPSTSPIGSARRWRS